MRSITALLSLAAPLLLNAAEPPATESQRYHLKVYNPTCRLLATGVLDLRVAEPDENGIRRVSGDRTFDPQVDDSYPFGAYSWEVIGRIENEAIRLNLDRNVFDSNTYVRGNMIDSPEPGFEGTWQHSGWGLGPSGRIVAARAPAEPTKPCEDLPEPVTEKDRQEQMSELIRSIEDGLKPLPKQNHDRPSDPSPNEGAHGNEAKNEGGSQDT